MESGPLLMGLRVVYHTYGVSGLCISPWVYTLCTLLLEGEGPQTTRTRTANG